MNEGKAVYGPIDGKTIVSSLEKVVIPINQDLGNGNERFGSAIYLWDSKSRNWVYSP